MGAPGRVGRYNGEGPKAPRCDRELAQVSKVVRAGKGVGVRMTTSQKLRTLSSRIEQVQHLIRTKGHPDLKSAESRLSVLRTKVDDLGQPPPSGAEESLEHEFYSLLESEPRLRKAYLASVDSTLIDILSSKLEFYKSLSDQRRLTEEELRQMTYLQEQMRKP